MAELGTGSSRQRGAASLWTIVAIAVVVLLAVWGIFSRLHARSELRKSTDADSAPTVAVVKIDDTPPAEELVLPGNVQAFADAPIYARTNGYLKRWLVDIGTPVKSGQLLAEIDAPEVDQQYHQAQADLDTAQANETLARSTSERWKGLLETESVSKQETDEKRGDFEAKQALTASARANLKRLQDTQGFQRIVAPFDGTITARNTDVGQLIGSTSGGVELFHISDLRKLRVYVQVPQPYAPAMQVGLAADLRFAERAAQAYPAKIVRTADALEPNSRTLLVQLEVDNSQGELFPGAYTEVHFKLPVPAGALRIPANALIFRSAGLMVGTLSADHHVVLKPITVGRDFGTSLEVTGGLSAGESVIVNPPDSLAQGVLVRVAQPSQSAKPAASAQPAAPADDAKPDPNKGKQP
ncbi:MAG: efflux transporter periplasmic adaptor subunit [Nevskia sp.]|nr:efflux transporter periplasmic adaptor subunit [Nevskia sp.]